MKGLSIIIPTLNEEKYLSKLLDCLVNQSYDNFEVIVVDGNSTDATKLIVQKYKKKLNLNLVMSKKRNVAYQRNLGVNSAKHDRLLFLDADVSFSNDFLEKSLKQMKEGRVDVAIPRYCPLGNKWYYLFFFWFINIVFFITQKIRPCGIGMCIFSKKGLHEINPFDERLNLAEDMDYIRRFDKYKFLVLSTRLLFSVRRFEKCGTKKIMFKWLKCYWYFLRNDMTQCNKIHYFSEKSKYHILLIQPRNVMGRSRRYPPLSLITLASMTPENEFDVEIIDEQYEQINFDRKYDLVGITIQTILSKRGYEIADIFRKKKAKVILGGIHATFLPDEAEKHCDSLVMYEAENIWLKLLDDFKKGQLKRKYIGSQIDMKDFPQLKKKFFKKYYFVPTIQVSRGCPNSCSYCSVRAYNGNKLRTRPVDDVIRDIRNLTGKSIFEKGIGFVDDNLFADRDYAIALFKKMIPLKVYWGTYASIKVAFDEELLDYAYKSGCRILWIGFESINKDSLKSVNKFNLIERYEEGIIKLKEKGIFVCGLFMFGFDGDQPDVVAKTIDFSIKNCLDEVTLQILRPLPGTKTFERFKEEGRITTFDWTKYEGCVIVPKNLDPKVVIKDINQAYRKFFSLLYIIKRMRGLKDYSIKRLYIYFMINLSGWWKTKRGIPV